MHATIRPLSTRFLQAKVDHIFRAYDADSGGSIDLEEFVVLMKFIDNTVTVEDVQVLHGEWKNCDSYIVAGYF